MCADHLIHKERASLSEWRKTKTCDDFAVEMLQTNIKNNVNGGH